jgi:tetratricopeptide (TPR) repeat protein
MPAVIARTDAEADGSRGQGQAPASRRRGRRRGVSVRPGSVKQARLEAGLSLGQVARDDISRTAIYFVETGKAKPSLETLQLIATRTNRPLEFFLEDAGALSDEVALIELERLVATGGNAAAIDAGEALVARARGGRIAAQANLLLAMAYVRHAQPVTARSRAAVARAGFEMTGDVAMAAEALSWEAAGALMVQDPSALALAQEALLRCRSLKPVPQPAEAKILHILGTVHSSRHEYEKAIEVYEQAMELAGGLKDLRSLSYVYGNLSLAYQETGRFAEATRYAHRAMALYETLQDRVSIARAENNLAVLLLRQGDRSAALGHALKALDYNHALGIEAGRAHVLLTLAEIEVARRDGYSAARYATEALELAQRIGESANAGEAHKWLARIAAVEGDDARVDSEFAAAFELFDAAEAHEWNARAHAEYAEMLERRGDLAGANRHLRSALAAAGTPVQARDDLRTAIA